MLVAEANGVLAAHRWFHVKVQDFIPRTVLAVATTECTASVPNAVIMWYAPNKAQPFLIKIVTH